MSLVFFFRMDNWLWILDWHTNWKEIDFQSGFWLKSLKNIINGCMHQCVTMLRMGEVPEPLSTNLHQSTPSIYFRLLSLSFLLPPPPPLPQKRVELIIIINFKFLTEVSFLLLMSGMSWRMTCRLGSSPQLCWSPCSESWGNQQCQYRRLIGSHNLSTILDRRSVLAYCVVIHYIGYRSWTIVSTQCERCTWSKCVNVGCRYTGRTDRRVEWKKKGERKRRMIESKSCMHDGDSNERMMEHDSERDERRKKRWQETQDWRRK